MRKGKRIVVVDYEATISFKACHLDGDFNEIAGVKGDINLHDITIDNIKNSEYEITMTTSKKDPGSELIIKVIQDKGYKAIHQALLQFSEEAVNK